MTIKKNDKAYLLDFKIDIQTDNDIHYQELSLLFDKPQFLDLLPDLRRTYKIPNLFPIKDFGEELDNHLHNVHYQEPARVNLSKYKRIKEIKKSFPDFYEFLSDKDNHMPEVLNAECHLICFELNRPPYFVEVIEQAIFCGAVNSSLFKPTEAKVVNFEEMGAWPTLERVAILVSPTSTYEDVKKEFRKAKGFIQNDPRLSYYQPRTDTVNNIREYRLWYWQRLEGKSYADISNDWMEKNPETGPYDPGSDENFVLKGVHKYQQLLEL